ncbi:MAG: methylated-DNA--[Lachnospiraceae bacterium]|nr:methylated-DNA--[protein]-cysteine S-methyltransferase [Lachnospiraceae bacterium]
MKTREQVLAYGLSFPDTYQDAPFHDTNWQLVRYKGNQKAFLWTYERNGFLNKQHWNTIILDGSIPEEDVKVMIAESYDLISDSPTKRIYEAVQQIPKGYVATYGQVAEAAGDRKMARAVGNALHKNPDPLRIPCHRVVNAKGELSGRYAFGGADKQAERLAEEGVSVIDGRVDLKHYQWKT